MANSHPTSHVGEFLSPYPRNRVQILRGHAGRMSRRELGRTLGLTVQRVRELEAGFITIADAHALAMSLGCKPTYVLGVEDEPCRVEITEVVSESTGSLVLLAECYQADRFVAASVAEVPGA